MHPTALKYGNEFFDKYYNGKGKVVEIGSQDVNGSLKDFLPEGSEYIGVDFVSGKNVDVVINDPYSLPFDDESVDYVVCSSCFEHSEFFWLVFLEIIRILKPEGVLYLNVPSNGFVHKYPVDCWRFYPDAGLALENWAKYNGYKTKLLESFIAKKEKVNILERFEGFSLDSLRWNDFVAVFVKDETFSYEYKKRIFVNEKDDFCSVFSGENDVDYFNDQPEDFLLQNNLLSELHACKEMEKELIVKIFNLESQLKEKEQVFKSVLNSLSWRVTKPLRYISSLIK